MPNNLTLSSLKCTAKGKSVWRWICLLAYRVSGCIDYILHFAPIFGGMDKTGHFGSHSHIATSAAISAQSTNVCDVARFSLGFDEPHPNGLICSPLLPSRHRLAIVTGTTTSCITPPPPLPPPASSTRHRHSSGRDVGRRETL